MLKVILRHGNIVDPYQNYSNTSDEETKDFMFIQRYYFSELLGLNRKMKNAHFDRY